MSFADDVRSVLSDTMNLPQEFLGFLPQYLDQNTLPRPQGGLLDFDLQTSPVSTSGTTFAAGADVLTSPLAFTTNGNSYYLIGVHAQLWINGTAGAANSLRINLDGAAQGIFYTTTCNTANADYPLQAIGVIPIPAAGSHTLNARFTVSSGTGTIAAGVGGSGTATPILVTVKRLAVSD